MIHSQTAARTTGYRDLFAVRSMRPLLAVTVLARLGGTMWSLALVLFVLQRFHSPALAGLATFFSWVPGLLVSPIAGALLDRRGRVRLIALDLAVGACTVAVILALDRAGRLTPWDLLAVIGIGSLTLPLTSTGTRSLMPLLTPEPLWGRMNAMDSASYNAAQLLGPAAAGLLFAAVGGSRTLAAIALLWVAAMLVVFRVAEPRPAPGPPRPLLRDALAGLRYTFTNPVLRGLSVVVPLSNAGTGFFVVALPVFVLALPGTGPVGVGLLWSAFGVAALVAGLLFGRAPTESRERRLMGWFFMLAGAGFMITAVAGLTPRPLAIAGLGMLVAGALTGPGDVVMFTYRQRAVDPAWFGRAISVSMSVNALGLPVGSALAGPLAAVHPQLTLVIGAAVMALSGAIAFAVLPARLPERRVKGGSGAPAGPRPTAFEPGQATRPALGLGDDATDEIKG